MKGRLDIDVFRGQKAFRLGTVFLDDHQTQPAIVLDVPGPGDQLEPHPVLLQDRFGVHGLMSGVEKQDVMLVGQGHAAGRGLGGCHGRSLGGPAGPEQGSGSGLSLRGLGRANP